MQKLYKIDSSLIIKTITICISILFLFFLIGLIHQVRETTLLFTKSAYFLASLGLLSLYLFIYSNSPKKLIITNENEIKIQFPFKNRILKISDILSVTKVNKIATLTFGSNGFWGIIGFSNGDVQTYIKNSSEIILIKLEKKEILISCSNHLEFINDIQTRLSDSKQV